MLAAPSSGMLPPPPPSGGGGPLSLGGGGAPMALGSAAPTGDFQAPTDSSMPPADVAQPVPAPASAPEIPGDLPELEPALDALEAIPTKKALLLVNNFVISTVEFINKFSVLCERRLQRVSQSTRRVEISLAILEAKLNSVPWLKDARAQPQAQPQQQSMQSPSQLAQSQSQQQPTGVPQPPALQPDASGALPPPPPPGSPPPPAASGMPGQPVPSQPAQPAVDPRYQQYFRMVNMGVPPEVLRNKLQAEGLDPDEFQRLLDSGAAANSQALVPVARDSDESGSDSEAEFD